ncbi:MAG: hypothetical protein WAX44_01535 [Minisyncoccia bacterium]
MKYKITVITPKNKNDYLTDTVIDGLLALREENYDLEFYMPDSYPTDLEVLSFRKSEGDFFNYAIEADIILFAWGKDNTNYELAEKINRYERTIFIDGSEIGRNGRYDEKIQKSIIEGTYEGRSKIDLEMEKKCTQYLRREKPYLRNIIPFPFGIERKYTKHYSENTKKDIDFFCVFGQDEYPIMRREVRGTLIEFCKKNNFKCFTEKTDKDNFYRMLSRSRVGISVGGGGFDTARFWEILGNNCILLTETIDIYEPNSNRLKYERIRQFKDLSEFKLKLEKLGEYLKSEYDQDSLSSEYQKIIVDHSSKSRVLEIIKKAKEKGIID